MSIFISTGELSGDMYAARLSAELRRILPEERIWGMAGNLASGMERVWNNDRLHIIGLGRILTSLPSLFSLRNELARAVIAEQPKAVIVIDSPDFHIPLLSKIRAGGYTGKVIYVCPPTIWAWRSGRAKYLKRYCDLCLPLFSFEKDVLDEKGVRSFWSAHPMMDEFANYTPVGEVLPDDPKRIALLPGSRRSEISSLLPILEESGRALAEQGWHPVLSVAPGLDRTCRKLIENNTSGIEWTEVSGRNLMYASRFVIGACGTAAVESMLLNRYMIVLYRGTALEWRIYKALTHTQFVAVPNVLAGRMFFPELLQDDVTLENVMKYANKFITDEKYQNAVSEQLLKNREIMGNPGGVARWADEIKKLISQP